MHNRLAKYWYLKTINRPDVRTGESGRGTEIAVAQQPAQSASQPQQQRPVRIKTQYLSPNQVSSHVHVQSISHASSFQWEWLFGFYTKTEDAIRK